MTSITIKFHDNKLGLEAWYVNQYDTIIECVPAELNDKFKGKLIQSPSPMRRNVNPAITSQDGKDLQVVQATIHDFNYAKRAQPADLNS